MISVDVVVSGRGARVQNGANFVEWDRDSVDAEVGFCFSARRKTGRRSQKGKEPRR
jgi:hypothetical protein